MYAIASLFDPFANQKTEAFWKTLEDNCGLSGIKTTPDPHFSWLGTEDLLWEPVKERLKNLAVSYAPFTVQTAGLGLFTGKNPILYIPVVKTQQLMSIHQRIWDELLPYILTPNLYYSPNQWMPHITLAYGDLTIENLPCAIQGIIEKPLDFTIQISNISALFHTPEQIGIKQKFLLTG